MAFSSWALSKVLVDEIGIGIDRHHHVVQTLHPVDARLVEGVRGGIAAVGVRIIVAKSLHKVETETVHLIFRQPIAQHVVPLTLHERETLVPVVEHAVGMGSGGIVEWIRPDIIHPVPWMLPVALG